jgi:hypothetical protein
MNDPLITIETSCGEHFELHVTELSDRQLIGLLEKNGERKIRWLCSKPGLKGIEWVVFYGFTLTRVILV